MRTGKEYRTYFSFNVDILKAKDSSSQEKHLEQDELSFEELYYQEYEAKNRNELYGDRQMNKENTVVNYNYFEGCNLDFVPKYGIEKRQENGRLSILKPVFDENKELKEICEHIDTININESATCLIEKLRSCGKFDKTEDENVKTVPKGRYFLISMFNSAFDGNGIGNYTRVLFEAGSMATINPYHVRSRSFRESIMLNFINERFSNYFKFKFPAVPYMLHQVNLSSVLSRVDAPELSQASYKSGYTFTLEISDNHRRMCVLKEVIGCGANASVFSADVCTVINNEVVGVFTCAVKIQHRDLGLNIRELYCGMILYKRNKKRVTEKQFDYFIGDNNLGIEEASKENSDRFLPYKKLGNISGRNSYNLQRTARSSISTNFPQSNVNSCRNSVNSIASVDETGLIGNCNSLVSNRSSVSSKAISNLSNSGRLSISSNYSLNYLDSPTDGSILTDPITISEGITVFCITELFIVSSSASGLIQNILNRETMKGNNKTRESEGKDSINNSVGISILPTSPGSKSLQGILNEHYLKNGVTMEEPIVLFLTFQFAEVLLAFNNMKVIHGDIKPDNVLLYPNVNFKSELETCNLNERPSHPLIPEGHSLPVYISIIDFGRSLDIGEIYKNTLFEGNCHAKNFLPPVMLENLPWLHHIDIFGIASTIHCLITGRYMELTKWKDEIFKCNVNLFQDSEDGGYILNVYNYKIKNQSSCIKRSWNYEFWSNFMSNCINFCPILLSPQDNVKTRNNGCEINSEIYGNTGEVMDLNVTIEELSQNANNFLEKVQQDIIDIFNSNPQMKSDLYKLLLKIRKLIGGSSVRS